MTRLAVLMLAICRTAYCWIFFFWTCFAIHTVYTNIRSLARTHSLSRGDIVSNATFAVYSVVLGIAWWMILRGKPGSKQWAIAANLTLTFTYAPVLVFGYWQGFLKAEFDIYPVVLFGIVGVIIFIIPYRGWRHKSQGRELAPQS